MPNPTKPGKHPIVRPMEGWQVQSAYGTLRTFSGVDLVRLEDVHAWLIGRGVPPKDAVLRVFSPFYEASLVAADGCGDTNATALLGALFAVNATTYPEAMFREGALSKLQSVRFLASAFPDLGHVRLEDGSVGGLIYSMGEGALRVWRGSADISTDHLALRRDKQERKADQEYSIQWPADGDLRKLLGRLAVPVSVAYELWGWGVPQAVIPEEGWTDRHALGFQRAQDAVGNPVALVRLSDLIRWLESVRNVPRTDAIQAFASALPNDVMQWLYRIADGKWAELVPHDATFGGYTAESLQAEKNKAFQTALQQERDAQRNGNVWGGGFANQGSFRSALTMKHGRITDLAKVVPVEPGRPALLAYLERWLGAKTTYTGKDGSVCDTLDIPRETLARLAIPHAKAHELWAWGSVEPRECVQTQRGAVSAPMPAAVASAEVEPTSVLRAVFDWDSQKTRDALLKAFDDAPGKSARAKSEYLANTEKWGQWSAETLRKKAAEFKKTAAATPGRLVNGGATTLSNVWGNTQRKSRKTG